MEANTGMERPAGLGPLASSVALLAGFVIALLVVLVQPTWAGFDSTTSNDGNSFAAGPDFVAPTVDEVLVVPADQGSPGWVGGDRPYSVYAQLDDTGNPATGVDVVTANLNTISAGETAVPLQPGTWTVAGVTYTHRTGQVTADAGVSGLLSFSLTATDVAGNSSTSIGWQVQADSTPPSFGAPLLVVSPDGSTFRVYTSVTDAGSGLETVTGDVGELSDAGSVPLSDGSWTIDGVTYTHRSDELAYREDLVPDTYTVTVTATDVAGNTASQPGEHDSPVPPPANVAANTTSCVNKVIQQRGSATTYLDDHAKSGSNGFILAVPTGVQTGDLLVVNFIATNRQNGPIPVTPPAGWTLVAERSQYVVNINTDMMVQTYIRAAVAPEPASYTWDFVDVSIAGGMVAYSGVDVSDPIADVSIDNGFSTTAVAPSVTPGITDAHLLGFAGMNSKYKATWTSHPMATALWNVEQHGSGNHQSISHAGETPLSSPDPTGTRSWTSSHAEPWIASLLALRPDRSAIVEVTWDAVPNVDGYRVTRSDGPQWSVPGGTTDYSDMTAVPGASYTYSVEAERNGQFSDPADTAITVDSCPSS